MHNHGTNGKMHNFATYMKKLLLLLFFAGNLATVKAQFSIADSVINAPLIDMSYAFQIPGGDLSARFGVNSNMGLSVFYKTKKNRLYGIGTSFIFSSNVRETDMIETYQDKDEIPLGLSGLPADIFFYQRGFTLEAKVGQVFSTGIDNPNSGFMVILGAGIMQHNIRIEDDNADIPMMNFRQNKKGYDRMTFGPMLSQFVGYRHLSNRRLINFFAGFEFMQGFTRNVREVQYDIGFTDQSRRLDLLYSIRVGWTLPLYKKAPQEFYFN